MEPLAPIPFPPAADAAEDVALNEVDVAIALVARGVAVRVRIAGLSAAIAEARGRDRRRAGRQRRAPVRRRALVERRDVHGRAAWLRQRPAEPEPSARRRILQGRRPADRRVIVEAPPSPYFRHAAPGVVRARLAAGDSTSAGGRLAARTRRVLFGRPLATDEEGTERLSKTKALAVFSSDNLSSVAYATEAILFTLLAAGQGAFWLTLPISLVIVAILGIIVISYRQTIAAYPNGGGSYIVAKANLGTSAGLDRGRCAAHRLRADGVGQRRRRDRRDHLGVPGAARRLPGRARGRGDPRWSCS